MVNRMTWQEQWTLEQLTIWGNDPVVVCDIERIQRDHEAALAERPQDDSTSEGGLLGMLQLFNSCNFLENCAEHRPLADCKADAKELFR